MKISRTLLALFTAVTFTALVSAPLAQAENTRTPVLNTPVALLDAYQNHISDQLVEITARVTKNLKDDRKGSPHQRFLVRLDNGLTLLVAHNIDLAPRVPVRPGDQVQLRGEYEWNNKGGVIHWTHHDPRGKHPGGWIKLQGRTYQ